MSKREELVSLLGKLDRQDAYDIVKAFEDYIDEKAEAHENTCFADGLTLAGTEIYSVGVLFEG